MIKPIKKNILRKLFVFPFLFLTLVSLKGQCDQNYEWAVWNNFSGNSATGSIDLNGQTISMEIQANYSFNSTTGIFGYTTFNSFGSPIPNSTVPRTTWSVGSGGETTMCFSETVANPVLLLASIGSGGTPVTLELSLPYIPIFDGGGMTFVDNTTIIGAEGFTILLFPGNFECITIFSSTPEYYTNLTWGLNPPIFPVTIVGDSVACDSVVLMANGGDIYEWSGGQTPTASTNTFTNSGTYFLTVTDAIGCSVVTSINVQVTNSDCTDCAGTLNGTAVYDECGVCLEPTDPDFNQTCFDCAGTINGSAIIDECGDCLEPSDPIFNQSCADCAGTPNGMAIIDDCGECLELTDPNYNQSCTDCNGILNGTAVYDDCGVCLEPTDPNYNQSCLDCAGTVNGLAIIDECGDCLEPTDPNYNQACADCAGIPFGTAVIDDCGECLELTDPNYNQSCLDCEGTLNGTAEIDECGECLEPADPVFNQSCADCAGTPNGLAIIDDCGECLEYTDPKYNQSCTDCEGVLFGAALIDECGECFKPTDSRFNETCIEDIFIPNSFSPNNDGINDQFQIFKNLETIAQVNTYKIFSRWGALIFESNNFDFEDHSKWWNGDHNKNQMESGVYVYYIEVLFKNGNLKNYLGDITIIK